MSGRQTTHHATSAFRLAATSMFETVFFILLLLLLISILLPSLSRARELSKRLVCAANMKGLGTSQKYYANDYSERWSMPAFDASKVGEIHYVVAPGSGKGTGRSPSRTQPSRSGDGGATELSVTRAWWMFLRSGDVSVKQFVCPSSRDEPQPGWNIDMYYDFSSIEHISYGYQVPFGPMTTRAREGCDNRMVLAADKGPAYLDPHYAAPQFNELNPARNPRRGKSLAHYNSRNHGGEGQNALFADGHVTFEKTPAIGIDDDNIYTAMLSNKRAEDFIAGEWPAVNNRTPFQPIDSGGKMMGSTDSLIFP